MKRVKAYDSLSNFINARPSALQPPAAFQDAIKSANERAEGEGDIDAATYWQRARGYVFDWGYLTETREVPEDSNYYPCFTTFSVCPTQLLQEGWSLPDIAEVWSVWCENLQDELTRVNVPVTIDDGDQFHALSITVRGVTAESIVREWIARNFLPHLLPKLIAMTRELKTKWDAYDDSDDWENIRIRLSNHNHLDVTPTMRH